MKIKQLFLSLLFILTFIFAFSINPIKANAATNLKAYIPVSVMANNTNISDCYVRIQLEPNTNSVSLSEILRKAAGQTNYTPYGHISNLSKVSINNSRPSYDESGNSYDTTNLSDIFISICNRYSLSDIRNTIIDKTFTTLRYSGSEGGTIDTINTTNNSPSSAIINSLMSTIEEIDLNARYDAKLAPPTQTVNRLILPTRYTFANHSYICYIDSSSIRQINILNTMISANYAIQNPTAAINTTNAYVYKHSKNAASIVTSDACKDFLYYKYKATNQLMNRFDNTGTYIRYPGLINVTYSAKYKTSSGDTQTKETTTTVCNLIDNALPQVSISNQDYYNYKGYSGYTNNTLPAWRIGDVTTTATYEPKTYKVTFSINTTITEQKNVSESIDWDITKGVIKFKNPTADYYDFSWEKDANGNDKNIASTSTIAATDKGLEIKGTFTPIEYKFKPSYLDIYIDGVKVSGASSKYPKPFEYSISKTVSLNSIDGPRINSLTDSKAPIIDLPEGYIWDKEYFINNNKITKLGGDVLKKYGEISDDNKIKVYFSSKQINITCNMKDDDGNDISETIKGKFNKQLPTLPTVSRKGYTFNGWSDGAEKVSQSDYIVKSSDYTINAEYTPVNIKITYSYTDDNDKDITDSFDIDYDEEISDLPTPTKDGYTFIGWFDGDTEVKNGDINKFIEDVSLVGKFEIGAATEVTDEEKDIPIDTIIAAIQNSDKLSAEQKESIVGTLNEAKNIASSIKVSTMNTVLSANTALDETAKKEIMDIVGNINTDGIIDTGDNTNTNTDTDTTPEKKDETKADDDKTTDKATNTKNKDSKKTNPDTINDSQDTNSDKPVLKTLKLNGLKVKKGKKKITITYKKLKGYKYNIQVSTSKKFKAKNTKEYMTSKTKFTVKKLKGKKTYYVRVRAINDNVVSSWSKTVKVKIKK